MAKETVRYPDEVADLVAEAAVDRFFEQKSAFYRFAAKFTLEMMGVEDFDDDSEYQGLKSSITYPEYLGEDLYNAFATYASGLADRNERVAATGLEYLSDIDEELGEIAERELEKID